MPAVRPLLLLLALVAVLPAPARAEQSLLRLGVEGGGAWASVFPDRSFGPAGAVRVRLRLSERLLLGTGLHHQQQPGTDGNTLRSTLLPLTLGFRLDSGPVAPFVAAGITRYDLRLNGEAEAGFGPIAELGIGFPLSGPLAFTTQLTYVGFGSPAGGFPVITSLTAGLSLGL